MSIEESPSFPVELLLDLYPSSPLLVHQLRDVPSPLKYQIIMVPINNALQLTIDQYSGYEKDHGILFSNNFNSDYGKFAHLISKRDLHYISKQIMKLNNYELLVSIAVKLNLWNEKKFVMRAVKKFGFSLSFASMDLQNDKQVVMTAIEQNGYAIQYASDEIKSDREIVKRSISRAGCALRYIAEELKRDREIVMEGVKENGMALADVCNYFGNDRQVVLLAVSSDGNAIRYASAELRNDKEIAMQALKKKGMAIRYLSENLRNDKDIAMQAMQSCGITARTFEMYRYAKESPLDYISESIRNEIEYEMSMK